MAVYTRYQKDLTLEERYIYGSSRVGAEYLNDVLASVHDSLNVHIESFEKQRVGDKRYELSNHLGNVLEVITDRKLAEDNGLGGVDFYTADVVSYSDYYPFGMQLPGRSGSASNYRMGFQGQEIDPEIKGERNSVNYKYRMHDPRIGRFFAVDPLSHYYSNLTPYQFSSNNPIGLVEIEGLEGDTPVPMGDEPAIKTNHEEYIQQKINEGVRPSMEGKVYKFQYNDRQGAYGNPKTIWFKKGEYWVYTWNSNGEYYDVQRQSNRAGEEHLSPAGSFRPSPPPGQTYTQAYKTPLEHTQTVDGLNGTITNPNNGEVTPIFQHVNTYSQSQIDASINAADQTVNNALTNVPAGNTVNTITVTVDTNLGETYRQQVQDDINAAYGNSGLTINVVSGSTGDGTVPYTVTVDSSVPYP